MLEPVFYIYGFVLGLCLGSFLNVVIHRLPRQISLIRPGSSCPVCHHPIRVYDNIPVLGYILLKGRCRDCGNPISLRYPAIELVSGFLVLAVFYKWGPELNLYSVTHLISGTYLALALLAITYTDLDTMSIPDLITLPGVAIGVTAAIAVPDPGLIGPWLGAVLGDFGLSNIRLLSLAGSTLGIFLGGGIVFLLNFMSQLILKRDGIGLGDFTLLSMVGAFLGWRAVFFTIFAGSIIALVILLFQSLVGEKLKMGKEIPFGPFLSLAAMIYLFFGEAIFAWYLP